MEPVHVLSYEPILILCIQTANIESSDSLISQNFIRSYP